MRNVIHRIAHILHVNREFYELWHVEIPGGSKQMSG